MSFAEKILNDIIKSKFNFVLLNKIGVHTYETYVRMCRELFFPIFEHVKSYVFQRSKTNYHFLILYKDYFEHGQEYYLIGSDQAFRKFVLENQLAESTLGILQNVQHHIMDA